MSQCLVRPFLLPLRKQKFIEEHGWRRSMVPVARPNRDPWKLANKIHGARVPIVQSNGDTWIQVSLPKLETSHNMPHNEPARQSGWFHSAQ